MQNRNFDLLVLVRYFAVSQAHPDDLEFNTSYRRSRLTIAGVSAITDADLTKYKQAIATTIENVDASQIEITANSARLRRLTDSVVLEVTTSSPTAAKSPTRSRMPFQPPTSRRSSAPS